MSLITYCDDVHDYTAPEGYTWDDLTEAFLLRPLGFGSKTDVIGSVTLLTYGGYHVEVSEAGALRVDSKLHEDEYTLDECRKICRDEVAKMVAARPAEAPAF